MDEDPLARQFRVAFAPVGTPVAGSSEDQRRYQVRQIRSRLHEARFRNRLLPAYRERCAMCRLGHRSLLDAAHIVPDIDDRGHPDVRNGLALCKIHHAAFDVHLLGVRPSDLTVEVQHDVLDEVDGPMLRHGLQDLHGQRLAVLPRRSADQPDPERLELRYAQFRAAS